MIKLGLTQTWAYHCLRCNYLWFPKDFDAFTYNTAFGGRNIFFRKSPKSCARCKSKYWKSLPKRKTKHTPDPKKGVYGHDMLTTKRIRAEQREIIRCLAELDKREKFLDDYCKKRNIVLDNINFDKDEKEKGLYCNRV